MVFAAEGAVAWSLAGVNLLVPASDAARLTPGTVVAIYAVGIAASLPVTFVPFAALFDGASVADAFALSTARLSQNVPALAMLAMISFLLVLAGLATMGLGLVLALPWIAAASYAAWKEIFGRARSGAIRRRRRPAEARRLRAGPPFEIPQTGIRRCRGRS